MHKEAWSRIENNTRDSLFVRELAVAMWGTKTLWGRSLRGKACPTTKTTSQAAFNSAETPNIERYGILGSSSHVVFCGMTRIGFFDIEY